MQSLFDALKGESKQRELFDRLEKELRAMGFRPDEQSTPTTVLYSLEDGEGKTVVLCVGYRSKKKF